MKVNNKEIGFSIKPRFDKVVAEIFEVYEMKQGDPIHIQLLSKEFGSMFRKPNNNDYIKARAWIYDQMNAIENANKPLTP